MQLIISQFKNVNNNNDTLNTVPSESKPALIFAKYVKCQIIWSLFLCEVFWNFAMLILYHCSIDGKITFANLCLELAISAKVGKYFSFAYYTLNTKFICKYWY